ncbi:hypothetical protein D3C72_2233380 [compost metagenome]
MASGQTGQVNHSNSLAWLRTSDSSEWPSVIFHCARPRPKTSAAASTVMPTIVSRAGSVKPGLSLSL